MTIRVTRRGVLATGRAEATARREVFVWVDNIAQIAREDVRRFSPKDTGAFRRSISKVTQARGAAVVGRVFSTAPDALERVIEFGRRPGQPMPPAGALLPWMGRHGIPAAAEFLVRRKIARDGTRAQKPFAKTYQRWRGNWAVRSGAFGVRLVRSLS
jgi:hypothetical protein